MILSAARVSLSTSSLSTSSASCAACSWNGACLPNGTCACDAPWTGAGCDVLDLLPLTASSEALGYQGSSSSGELISSWGGSVILGDDGLYHMYAAEMGGFCGINVWLSNSIVVHATSADPLTVPFSRRSVVQGAFAHEPIAARAPTGEYVVFFSAVLPPEPLPVKGGEPCAGCANGVSVASCGTDANRNASVMLPTYMVFSADPDGPWSAPQMVPGTDVYADSNFAPWIDSDGSLVALTRGQVYRSSNWRNISDYRAVGRWSDRGEDPFIWRNSVDGVLHGIIHVGRPNTFGLHLYSTDGTSWTASAGHAYTSVLSFTNGTELNLASKQTHPTHPPARPPLTLDNPSWALGNLSRPSTGLPREAARRARRPRATHRAHERRCGALLPSGRRGRSQRHLPSRHSARLGCMS